MEIVIRRMSMSQRIGHPRADIHVRDPHALDLWCAAVQALFHPLQKDPIKASRLVMRIARNGRKTTPFPAALAQHAVIAIGRGGPVENRGLSCNKLRPGSQ